MPTLVPWTETLSVGLPDIDDQHRRLVILLNDYYSAIVGLRGQKELLRVLSSMADYALEHFVYEEDLMAQAGYPKLPRHRAEHQAFIEAVATVRRRLEAGDFVPSPEILQYLRGWLPDHILSSDKEFGRWQEEQKP